MFLFLYGVCSFKRMHVPDLAVCCQRHRLEIEGTDLHGRIELDSDLVITILDVKSRTNDRLLL